MKKVSIIMPYFNKSSFFEEAYHSVLNQNYSNIEIIIIYDDHNLTELSFVKKIINNRKNTILIINKKNYGVGFSRNIGINRSKGFYIAFLDCDDVWKKNKLRNQKAKKKLAIIAGFCSVDIRPISGPAPKGGRQQSMRGIFPFFAFGLILSLLRRCYCVSWPHAGRRLADYLSSTEH
jgi:glycosyltransferase involved in cell wall biosynthesis